MIIIGIENIPPNYKKTCSNKYILSVDLNLLASLERALILDGRQT
jgi:hypothetical protein